MNLTTRIAFREILGGWRGLIVFYLCVIISATVLITIGEITANFKGNFQERAKEILGGDLEITTSNFQMSNEELKAISKFGKVSMVSELRAMASFNETNKLVELKSIDENYPLYGQIENDLSELLKTEGVLVAEELKINMGIEIGDDINIAGHKFKVLGIAKQEPDWLASALVLGPRILVSNRSLAKTYLIQPGSLIRYKYRVQLNNELEASEVKSKIKDLFPHNSWIVRDSKDGNTVFVNSVNRLEFFLILAGISNLLVCGIGIAAATKFFMEKKLAHVAILKSCGASKKTVISTYLKLIMMISIDSYLSSSVLALLITYFVLPNLNAYLPFAVDFKFYWLPVFTSFLFVMLTIITFTLPVLLNAVDIKPASLFRGIYFFEFNHTKEKLLIYLSSLVLLIVILLINSDNAEFLFGYLLAAILTFFIYYYSSFAFKRFVNVFNVSNMSLRLALGNIRRPSSSLTTIMLAVGISLSVFIVLTTTQYNITARLNDSIPSKAPSLFLIDVQENQVSSLKKMTLDRASNLIIKPSVQGIITHLNGIPIEKLDINKNSDWAVRSHRRLSYSSHLPTQVSVSKGEWWDENYNGEPLVSVDQNLAEGLGVDIGSTMTFNVMGRIIEAKIHNLREVDYSTFNINFAVIFSGGVLDSFPKSYFATLKVTHEKDEFVLMRDISEHFPNVVTIKTSDGIELAKKYVGDIVSAIEIIVLVTLVSGLIVLAASFLANQEKRKYDIVVLKVLGAGSFEIYKTFVFEAVILAIVAGCISIGIGNLGSYLILKYLKFSEFNFSIFGNMIILVSTALTVIVVIILSSYKVFNTKPINVLRNE